MNTTNWIQLGAGIVLVVVAIVLWTAKKLFDAPTFATDDSVEWNSRTNGEEAILTMTNLGKRAQYWCGYGVVSNQTGATTKSIIACKTVGPRETVELRAPYRVGAVRELCANGALNLIDWDKCSFTTVPVK